MTIATNMAGRGTDIKLGGNPEMRVALELDGIAEGAERDKRIAQINAEVEANKKIVLTAGGLFVIGTERHKADALTTSCVAAQVGRVIPVVRDFTYRLKMTSCAFSVPIVLTACCRN